VVAPLLYFAAVLRFVLVGLRQETLVRGELRPPNLALLDQGGASRRSAAPPALASLPAATG